MPDIWKRKNDEHTGAVTDVLRGVRSLPVGYVRIVDMYPLDFEEFCWANGEVDFVCERGGGAVLPIEVKSGKDYKRHSALSNILSSPNYEIEQAIVLCESNVIEDGKVAYLPIYMIMFV